MNRTAITISKGESQSPIGTNKTMRVYLKPIAGGFMSQSPIGTNKTLFPGLIVSKGLLFQSPIGTSKPW